MPTAKDIGNRGEEIASIYLQQHGFKILARNWRTRWCEIDIIAQKDAIFYFVEVKYRASTVHGSGVDYITPKKLQQMQFAAELWGNTQKQDIDMVLAVISIDGSTHDVTFIEIA